MDKLSMEQLREVLVGIERALECGVCLECIRGDALMCTRGHGLCQPCGSKLQACPLCRKPFSDINPTMLNSVIRLMPRQCRHEYNGCDQLTLPSSAHDEELCGYRETSCWLAGCDWLGLVNDMLNHLQCDHRAVPLATVDSDRRLIQWDRLQLGPGSRSTLPLYAFNTVIWARAEVNCFSDVVLSFHLVPTKGSRKLLAVVFFKRGDVEYSNTVAVVEKENNVTDNNKIVIPSARVKLFSCVGVLSHHLKIVKDS